jgi:hypothetical protein
VKQARIIQQRDRESLQYEAKRVSTFATRNDRPISATEPADT